MKKISRPEAEAAYQVAVKNRRIGEEDTAVIFYSRSVLLDRLQILKKHFPSDTLHAIAIKTNHSPEVLSLISKAGFGLEAASFEEVLLAKSAGVPSDKIVFDSPVKTIREIRYCHDHLQGITLNANTISELERYPDDFSGKIGLRINPLVEADAPGIFNVSLNTSKFGVPISKEEEIIQACLTYKKISGLHIHIGSSIKNYSANIIAIKKITDLAEKINFLRAEKGIENRINWIDIGGGIDFEQEVGSNSMADFIHQIKVNTSLFEQYKVITEFGKFVHQDTSFVVSDIEYIEQLNDKLPSMVYIHVGADLFVRKTYSDIPIYYPCGVIKSKGNNKDDLCDYTIAGPLCFAGDILFDKISLPHLESGDKLVIYNIGANTLSMWSGHCSRKVPKLILIE